MATLPPKPSREHLRAQAKRLLKAYLANDPEAQRRVTAAYPGITGNRLKLADAQWIVAREHDFPSWAKLKGYVEALAQANLHSAAVDTASLVGFAKAQNAEALGKTFAATPLRDILRARDTLGKIGALDTVLDTLIAGLVHPEPRIRFNCAGALDHLADARCAEPLTRLLSDPVPRVRRAALHSLSCDACKLTPLTTPEAFVSVLIEMAQRDPSIRVRRVAAFSLTTYAYDPSVIATLRALSLTEHDRTILRTATAALQRLGTTNV